MTDTDSSPGLSGVGGDRGKTLSAQLRLAVTSTAEGLRGSRPHSQQAVHVLGGGRDVVVVLAGETQLGAVALVDDVPELFGGQRLQSKHAREGK